jgi:hypothetical protein
MRGTTVHSVYLLYTLSTQPDPPPPCYTLYEYIHTLYLFIGGREEKGDGAPVRWLE